MIMILILNHLKYDFTQHWTGPTQFIPFELHCGVGVI